MDDSSCAACGTERGFRFRCSECGFSFCQEHAAPAQHNCPAVDHGGVTGEVSERVRGAAGIASTVRGAVGGASRRVRGAAGGVSERVRAATGRIRSAASRVAAAPRSAVGVAAAALARTLAIPRSCAGAVAGAGGTVVAGVSTSVASLRSTAGAPVRAVRSAAGRAASAGGRIRSAVTRQASAVGRARSAGSRVGSAVSRVGSAIGAVGAPVRGLRTTDGDGSLTARLGDAFDGAGAAVRDAVDRGRHSRARQLGVAAALLLVVVLSVSAAGVGYPMEPLVGMSGTGGGLTDDAASGDGPSEDVDTATLEAAILEEVNATREAEDVPPLERDPELATIATYHSQDMAEQGYAGVESPTGESVGHRFLQFDYDCDRAGQMALWVDDADLEDQRALGATVVDRWLASEDHAPFLHDERYDRAGVGASLAADGRLYVSLTTCGT